MSYTKETNEIRAEVSNGFAYVRNLAEKGGVISAIVNDKKSAKVIDALKSVENETFSQVWDMMIKIKGVKFDYQRN